MRDGAKGHEVVGIDSDGRLLCRDIETGEVYNCGETLNEYGEHNLTEDERGIIRAQCALPPT